MTDTDLTPEQLEQLAAEREDLRKRVADHTERLAVIDSRLRSLGPGDHPAGIYTVAVKPGANRLDLAAVAADHPIDQFPELWVGKPDTKRVREHIAPAALRAYERQDAARIEVR